MDKSCMLINWLLILLDGLGVLRPQGKERYIFLT